jgi:hypothetical protein
MQSMRSMQSVWSMDRETGPVCLEHGQGDRACVSSAWTGRQGLCVCSMDGETGPVCLQRARAGQRVRVCGGLSAWTAHSVARDSVCASAGVFIGAGQVRYGAASLPARGSYGGQPRYLFVSLESCAASRILAALFVRACVYLLHCLCAHARIYTHQHTRIHAHAYAFARLRAFVCVLVRVCVCNVCIYIYACMCMCEYTHTHTHTHTHSPLYMCEYICMYVLVCICVCVGTYACLCACVCAAAGRLCAGCCSLAETLLALDDRCRVRVSRTSTSTPQLGSSPSTTGAASDSDIERAHQVPGTAGLGCGGTRIRKRTRIRKQTRIRKRTRMAGLGC